MKEDQNSIIEDLIAKSLSGEASAEEEKHLQEWISSNKENEAGYNMFRRVFELGNTHYSKTSHSSLNIDVDQEWNHFLNTIDKTPIKRLPTEEKSPKSMNWLRIAAAILFVVGSGFLINYLLTTNNTTNYYSADIIKELTLPDGSRVTLNIDSELSYKKDFGDAERTIKLTGEAFFDVEPNKEKPFIILTEKARIQVLGTSFNVQTTTKTGTTEVVVATGRVQFSSSKTKEHIILEIGDLGVLTNNNVLKSLDNTNVNFNSWKTRKIIFNNKSLGEVVETLNKVYNSDIVLNPSVSNDCDITVTFDQQSLDAVLNVLKSTLDLTYKKHGDKIEITDTGC